MPDEVPPPAWQQAPPGYPTPPVPVEQAATSALIAGIASVVCELFLLGLFPPLGFVLGIGGGITAIVFARSARRRIAASPTPVRGGDYATAGLVMGIVAIVAGLVGLLITAVIVAGFAWLISNVDDLPVPPVTTLGPPG